MSESGIARAVAVAIPANQKVRAAAAAQNSLDRLCCKRHNMCMKQHICRLLASQRRRLGLSQQELAARAGLRREKISRIESKAEDIGVEDLCRLLDALGLELDIRAKGVGVSPSPPAEAPGARRLIPQSFHEASFIDGSKARILDWGKIPR